jgi:hypothetical protein
MMPAQHSLRGHQFLGRIRIKNERALKLKLIY